MNSKLKLADHEGLTEALKDLRSSETQLNWILLGYSEDEKDTLEMVNAGEGGLEEMKENLEPDQIRFGILECVVVGDDNYNAVKFVLVLFIGEEVPAGLKKAKAAGHKRELIDFIQEVVAIASEYQISTPDELTTKAVSAKLTKMSERYQDSVSVGQQKDNRQQLSRSEAAARNVRLSQLLVVDDQLVQDTLVSVYKEQKEWAILAYCEGKKDEIYLAQCQDKVEAYEDANTKIDGLKDTVLSLEPDNKIFFILFSFRCEQDGATTTKFLLITYVGEYVKALQKARSSPHRNELAEYIKQYAPFHSHYPATSLDDLVLEEFLFKLRT